MTIKLLTEHHSEFLSLKGGCKGSSESTLVKMTNCWKSRVMAHIIVSNYLIVLFINLQFGFSVVVVVVFASTGTGLSPDEKSEATCTATPTTTDVITTAYTNVRNFANYVQNKI